MTRDVTETEAADLRPPVDVVDNDAVLTSDSKVKKDSPNFFSKKPLHNKNEMVN